LLASTSTVKQERDVCDASTVKMSCNSFFAERFEFRRAEAHVRWRGGYKLGRLC